MIRELAPRLYADLIGKPFAQGGRGPDVFDCVGLALELAERRGISLPTYLSDEAELHRAMAEGGPLHELQRIPEPEAGCMVLMMNAEQGAHIGVMVSRFRMVHAHRDSGVVVETLKRSVWGRRVVGFYRLDGPAGELVKVEKLAPMAPGTVRVIHVTKPLTPSIDAYTSEHKHIAGETLETFLGKRLAKDPVTVSVNGRVWPAAQWADVKLSAGDSLVIAPELGGSGNLFRTLGELAILAGSIALIATGVGASLGVALGISTMAANAAIAGVVSIGGNLLMSAISSILSKAPKGSSPSYAFQGPSMLAQSGTVIPKGYGTMQSGGNVISSFVDVDGQDEFINVLISFGFGPARSIGTVYINGKDVLDYQNVQVFTRLGTNDQTPIGDFNRIVNAYPQQTQCLAGIPVVIPGTGTQTQALQVDVSFPSGVFFHTNDGNTIQAVITYTVEYSPAGANDWKPVLQPLDTTSVIRYDVNGNPYVPYQWGAIATDLPPNSGVTYALDNGPHNPGDPFTTTETVTTYDANGNHATFSKVCVGEWQLLDPKQNYVQVNSWTNGYQDYVAASTQTCYNRTNIYGLTLGKYDVRVTKYGSAEIHDDVQPGDNWSPNIGQDMWVHSVNEITYESLAYPNIILVGIRALATSQISGSSLNVNAVITYGLRSKDNNRMPAALLSYEEDNPACVAADMMLDRLYGGGDYPGIASSNIDRFDDEWVAWAELNDELVDDGNGGSIRRHVFNGICDEESTLWDEVVKVGQMSRAQPVQIGRDYGVALDAPDTPVQMFSVGNIVADSFNESWLDLDSRANQVEISFADKTRYYKQDNPIVYMDPANQDAGVKIKNTRIDGKGITDPAQAWHLARFRERSNQFLKRSGSFVCDVVALACRQGNVIVLQHDVPQWGWGGRTMPGSTATKIVLDRNDVEFLTGTSYSFLVLLDALERYSGTVSAYTAVSDTVTGDYLGTQLTLSSFDNVSRVTRAVLTRTDGVTADCAITATAAGSVTVLFPPDFTPAAGMTFALWDTDVIVTTTVSGVTKRGGKQFLQLATPLPKVPQDFATYIYGPAGTQKLARVQNIRKQSEFRAKLEWIDYDPNVYVDATPVVGETSAQSTSQPGVTNLTAQETFPVVAGSYVPTINLSWQNGRDTAGVAIYSKITTSGLSSNVTNSQPQMIARLTGWATSWSMQAQVGIETTFYVVGFDSNDDYQAFKLAPTATITAVGIAKNLLLGSSFATGFTYWNITPRSGDTLVPEFDDDGQAGYTIGSSALSAAQPLLSQVIPSSKWAVGNYLMLSGYGEDSCAVSSSPNSGQIQFAIVCANSSGTALSTTTATLALSGVTPTLTRCNTSAVQIPTGTASVTVTVAIGAASGSPAMPAASTVTLSHMLLEVATSGQTLPSAWADIDVNGQVLDIFTSGSSTGLRAQGSTLPSVSGTLGYACTDTTAHAYWTDLTIFWPDQATTLIQDGTGPSVTGLSATTSYYAYPYFDIINGGVKFVTDGADVSGQFFSAANAKAQAACYQDGRVPLAPAGLQITTVGAGDSGGQDPGGSDPRHIVAVE